MHLSNLNFSNFKNWKNFNTDLTKINLFFGQNSSGKSSIIQLLLLLKQTVENKDEKVVLYFGDDKSYVNLGNFDEVLNKIAMEKAISFGLCFNYLGTIQNFNVKIDKNKTGIIEVKSLNVTNITKGVSIDTQRVSSNYLVKYLENNNLVIKPKEKSIDRIRYFFELPFRIFNEKSIDDNLFNLEYNIKRLFENMTYIGPLRQKPQRRGYEWTGSKHSHFGVSGENTFDAIITSTKQNEKYTSKFFNFTGHLAEIVCKWLIEFGMADDFRIEVISEVKQLYQVNVKTKGATNWVDICDVGFGVSQILPIIALCYYAPQGSIIIIEQPEIHLHPKVQSGLGDLLIDAANSRGIQFIIESHSEHLLTRIQRRIAEEKIDGKEVKINFCNLVGGESVLEELKVNDFGEISNWPENFFGDEMEEIYQMQNAIIERKMKQESISDDNNI